MIQGQKGDPGTFSFGARAGVGPTVGLHQWTLLMPITSVTSVPGDWDYYYFRENEPGREAAGPGQAVTWSKTRWERLPQDTADSNLSLTATCRERAPSLMDLFPPFP